MSIILLNTHIVKRQGRLIKSMDFHQSKRIFFNLAFTPKEKLWLTGQQDISKHFVKKIIMAFYIKTIETTNPYTSWKS